MKYDKSKSFIENIKDIATILTFIFMISGLFSSVAFFYLDYRNDQRYLKLVEITAKLDPLYISIAAAKAQQRVEDIRDLEQKIFQLRFKKSSREEKGRKLDPYDSALLEKFKDDLLVLQSN